MNAKRKDMIGILPKRKILMRHGESRHNGVHHHTRPQYLVNGTRHGPGSPCRRALSPHDGQRRHDRCSSTCLPMPTLNGRSGSSDSTS